MVLDMENANIAGGGRGMQQEENQLPMSGYLGLFETYMSGYLRLFETCDWVCLDLGILALVLGL